MSSDRSFLDYVLEQARSAGPVASRKMFGEYALYLDGKVVALVCDNQVFVKPTEAGRNFIGEPQEAPPYPGAKQWFLMDDGIEDREWLGNLLRITARELPVPAPKSKTRKVKK